LIPIVLALLLVATVAWVYSRNSGIGVYAIEFKAAPMNSKETCSVLGAIAATLSILYAARRWQTPLARFLLALILLFSVCLILLTWWLSRPPSGLQSTFPSPSLAAPLDFDQLSRVAGCVQVC